VTFWSGIHSWSFGEDGPERQEFAEGPVDLTRSRHLDALLQELLELRVHREAGGRVVEGVADRVDQAEVDARVEDVGRAVVVLLGDGALEVGNCVVVVCDHRDGAGLRGVRLAEGALEAVLEIAVRSLVLLLRDVAAADERLGVEGADASLRLDEAVHQGLRHRRVVALVVPAAAVADEVDDDVALELLAVGERQLRDAGDGLGVVAVHVEDRRLDRLRDVGRVDRRAPLGR
jgi:hypothetical protein